MNLDVKYQVAPVMARSIVVQLYVPIAYAALPAPHVARLDRACEDARRLLQGARDEVAAAVQLETGLCPFCSDVSHPEGARCA